MFRNVYYDVRQRKIHLWYTKDGLRKYKQIKWTPYVFVPDPTGMSDIHSLDGVCVRKKMLGSYRDYKRLKEHLWCYENQMRPEIQFLAEMFYPIPDDELIPPKLRIFTIDIEILVSDRLPSYEYPKDPITVISVHDSIYDKVYVFGDQQSSMDMPNVTYFNCADENGIFVSLLEFFRCTDPDVITGWNVSRFDLPYIIERFRFKYGKYDKRINDLSPIRKIRNWTSKGNKYGFEIAGISVLDYLYIYKQFKASNLVNYRLDTVAEHELGEGKLDYSEYGHGAQALNAMYLHNHDKYVEYNVIDVIRVYQLENKLGFICGTIQATTLLTRTPLSYYQSQTKLIEGAMLTYFRRNKLCAPRLEEGESIPFEGGFVKKPQAGMHDWVIDLDITSSYPSHVITLNMSVETYCGLIHGFNEDEIVSFTARRRFPPFSLKTHDAEQRIMNGKLDKFNSALESGKISIAPNGAIFLNTRPGVIASVQRNMFEKRAAIKRDIKKLKRKSLEGEASKQVSQMNSLQGAIKVILNSTYGATSVPYSRYFNPNISSAITACGRNTIVKADEFANEYLNDHSAKQDTLNHIRKYSAEQSKGAYTWPSDCNQIDYVAYCDTDSLYIRVGDYLDLIDKSWRRIPYEKKIELILEISDNIQRYVNQQVFQRVQLLEYNSSVKDFKIELKQELVSKTALFVVKKRYAYHCVNAEGVDVDSINVKGIETIRSDTPVIVREDLKEILEMILKKAPDADIRKKVQEGLNRMYTAKIEDLAANVGIGKLGKYITSGGNFIPQINKAGKRLGVPWHIAGAGNYIKLLKYLELETKYEQITSNTKVKVVYVTENIFRFKSMSFLEWPEEFSEVGLKPDKEKMVERFLLKKLRMILAPMNKQKLANDDTNEGTVNIFF